MTVTPGGSIQGVLGRIAALEGRFAQLSGAARSAAVPASVTSFKDTYDGAVKKMSVGEKTRLPDTEWGRTASAYGNGRLPREMLVPIAQNGHRLSPEAASSFDKMVTEASNAGVEISITDSYRNYDQQVDLAKRKGLTSEGGYAAFPGTSQHGWGLAVDVNLTKPGSREWMEANASRFGWVGEVEREPWHYEFRGVSSPNS